MFYFAFQNSDVVFRCFRNIVSIPNTNQLPKGLSQVNEHFWKHFLEIVFCFYVFTSPGQCIFKIFFTDEMSGDIFVVLKLICLENEDPVQIVNLFTF